ncbi:hypothetical protein Pint_33611 [Pistacia integerrima]|uniref:Uncharacterized protein n=1 Tax=Pistacia integerrima TaxID=434235 RepID=A0ACC0X6S7_9ROSI|nr:hypothetical protein Pint_33611 [Pistacia integerrima]
MATITNKPSSSSPLPSTRPNPSARNSETKDPMRRSFTGNPFNKPSSIVPNSRGGFNPNTPANSPSDFLRRSSIGRESVSSLRDFTDKENGKDANLNTAKVRSPASVSKGTKNFMSPTISAASKFSASPRKKILAERNEPVRSSASFSDARSQVMEDNEPKPEKSSSKKKTLSFSDVKSLIMEDDDFLKPEMGLNQNKIEASHDSTISDLADVTLEWEKNDLTSLAENVNQVDDCVNLDSTITDLADVTLEWEKNDVTSLAENVNQVDDSVNLDPTFKIGPRTSCSISTPMLAPLDADPSMPPYDPKTNYLSPRPQFLHYQPNPLIELIRIKNRDGKRLEESFLSESDGEVSGILSDDSQKESEDVSSDETVKEEAEAAIEEEETEFSVSEPNPFSIDKFEESVQAKRVCKSKFFTRSKFFAFLVVMVVAGLSISVIKSPVTDLDFSNLYVSPEITEFAKVSFERLAQRSQLWAANSFSYLCKRISDLREVPKLGPSQYSNLTDLFEEYHREADVELKYEQNFLTPIWERDVGTKPSEEGDSEIETDENVDNSPRFEEQVHQEIDDISEDHTDSEPEEACLTLPAEEVEPSEANTSASSDDHNDIKPQTHQPEVILEATVQPESEAREPQVESNMNSYAETESTRAEANESQVESDKNLYAELVSTRAENIHQSSELDAAMGHDHPQISATEDITTVNGSEVEFLTTNVLGIFLLVLLSLLATTAFFKHAKKGKPSTPNAATPVDQPAMTKKLDYSPISVTSEHTFRERLSSKDWQTEVDMVVESCPSEMSSFKSSSYSKKGHKESSEGQSQERKTRKSDRRESLASSDFSMGSPSYGSFTTYEKIPKKHGFDDEVVTPVRRSSRLRNQVTSP